MTHLVDHIDTPLGTFAVVADPDGSLCAAGWAVDHPRMTKLLGSGDLTPAKNPSGLSEAFASYFAGDLGVLDHVPLVETGTPFQRDVWRTLRTIPYGKTFTYADIARAIGRPKAVRAVGLANGRNRLGVVVPCHRVIGSDGSLTGYGAGLDRKRWLLAHERRA